ncbi:type VII secretion target [Nocardia inohanensis]|uniref:type VII secretion target n=1 Tax=Nocardia inohanensis TaxID=209246 RepID=UPI0009FD96CB|nr:type VII secretion target [Nocardia inohanensis]
MHRILLDPNGIAGYAATAHTMATALASTAAGTATADPLLLSPAFGLIGADFLAAFTAALTTHTTTLADLSAVLTSLGVATTGSSASYTLTDATHAAAVRTTTAAIPSYPEAIA